MGVVLNMREEELLLLLLILPLASSAAFLTLLSSIEVYEVHVAFVDGRSLLIVIDA